MSISSKEEAAALSKEITEALAALGVNEFLVIAIDGSYHLHEFDPNNGNKRPVGFDAIKVKRQNKEVLAEASSRLLSILLKKMEDSMKSKENGIPCVVTSNSIN